MKLKSTDFKPIAIEHIHYYSHILPGGECLCLEPCLNGFEVALYDKAGISGSLIVPKVCTDIQGGVCWLGDKGHEIAGFFQKQVQAINKALELANEMIEEYNKSKK
ncbi:MAG: hypothetical protein V3T43_06240 [Nitrosomonadaceae bacterium]